MTAAEEAEEDYIDIEDILALTPTLRPEARGEVQNGARVVTRSRRGCK
jgi:hypothetical protein